MAQGNQDICLSETQIEQYMYGEPTPEQLANYEHHLANCKSCMQTLVQLNEQRSPRCAEPSDTLSMIGSGTTPDDSGDMPKALPVFQDVILEKPIGEGGFGKVYRGKQRKGNNRTVAIKMLLGKIASGHAQRIFRQETDALTRLEHHNIARIYQTDIAEDGTACIVMEYIAGRSLREFAHDVEVDLATRLRVADQLCKALAYIHERNIVHRDLSVRNILVQKAKDEFVPKIIDFGLSMDSRRWQTTDFADAGTREFKAPEQSKATANSVDKRADIYSLGFCIFELLTGQRAAPSLPRETSEAYRIRKYASSFQLPLLSDFPQLRKQMAQVQLRELDSVLAKACSIASEDRYESAEYLRSDLRRVRRCQPTSLRADDLPHRAQLFVRRQFILLLTSVAVMAGGVTAMFSNRSHRNRANEAVSNADEAIAEAGGFAKNWMDRVNPITAQEQRRDSSKEVVEIATVVSDESEGLKIRDTDPFLSARMTAANTLLALNESDLAIPDLERIVADCKQRFGEDADDTLAAQMHLAGAYTKGNRDEEAVAIYLDAFEVWKKRYGMHDVRTLSVPYYVSRLKARVGQHESAILMTDKIIEHYRPDPEKSDLLLVGVRMVRAQSLFALSRYQEATSDYEYVERGYLQAGLPASHPSLLRVNNDMALVEAELSDCASAIARMSKTAEETKRTYPKGAYAIDKADINLAIVFAKCGLRDRGIELLKTIRSRTQHPAIQEIADRELKLVRQQSSGDGAHPKP